MSQLERMGVCCHGLGARTTPSTRCSGAKGVIDARPVSAFLAVLFMTLAALALVFGLASLFGSVRHALYATRGGADPFARSELPDRAALLDEKRALLRAIKDLEYEHAVGKITDADFERLDRGFRVRAKEVIARLDADLAPYEARAEALVQEAMELRARAAPKEVASAPEAPEAAKEVAPEAPPDDDALRARARALREEAERLERMLGEKAATAPSTEAPDAPKGSEEVS